MNDILAGIEKKVGADNLATSCKEGGCEASLADVPFPRVVVSANKAFPAHKIEGKRCDYILFFMNAAENALVTVPIELKGDRVNVSEVSEQLQRGADFVNCFAPITFDSDCHPILFHNSSIHPADRKRLNRAKVQFRGIHLTINTARCNRPKNLANALPK